MAIDVETDGDRREIENFVRSFPLTPGGIIECLDLRSPIYRATACYGAFGREGVPWGRVDAKIAALPTEAGHLVA